MPHDRTGEPLHVGDVVEVVADGLHVPAGARFRIVAVHPEREVCNLDVEPLVPSAGLPAATAFCAANVRRVVEEPLNRI